jgi:hypothetical protein
MTPACDTTMTPALNNLSCVETNDRIAHDFGLGATQISQIALSNKRKTE